MRITHDTMIKVANDAVARKARTSSQVMAAYLCGSLLGEDYLLGGAADIDLVFVHTQPVEVKREVVRLTDDVHLDIAHHFHRDYRETRALRVHPWLGPTLNTCRVLYDPQHFMDFTQASVRGQFDRPDYVFERARQSAEEGRSIWFSLREAKGEPEPADTLNYLRCLEKTANSIAVLIGSPLTERRFLVGYAQRTATIGRSGLYQGILGLLGAPNLAPGSLGAWLPQWQDACLALPADQMPMRLHPDRLSYYAAGFQALLGSQQPLDLLWPLIYTWTIAAAWLPAESGHVLAWKKAVGSLGMVGPAFSERIVALDAYLDSVDETLEAWARANGAWQS